MYKQITFRKAERVLLDNGYKYERTKGSHHLYIRGKNRIVINLRLNAMVWKRICKKYGLK